MEFENYKIYGRCAVLRKGGKKMLVTVDVGPRIIFYGYDGGENIFFEDLNDTINRDSAFIKENLKDKGIWHIYGGHRLWKSPEYEDTYYPDNSPVRIVETDDKTDFISEDESTTGLRKILSVQMHDDGNATVTHTLINVSDTVSDELAVWTLSVMDKGAKAYIPLPEEDTGLLPNRNLVLWSYTDLKDDRFTLENNYIEVEQKNRPSAFKIGVFTNKELSVSIKNMLFKMSCETKEGRYSDYSCNVECYTCDKMLEIETLSPVKALSPGSSIVHEVKWSLDKI